MRKLPPYYYDIETMGLCGPIVLIQYALGTGPITIFEPWLHPVQKTLDLIELFMHNKGGVIGFNLAFDHFQLSKLYTIFSLIKEIYGPNKIPLELEPNQLYELEYKARDGAALRPYSVCDLMIEAQKGKYQKCMEREPIIIRRIPDILVKELTDLLNEEVRFESILFQKRSDKSAPIWKPTPSKDKDDNVLEGLYDIQCIFAPSFSLKDIAVDLEIVEDAQKFKDVGMPKEKMPVELVFAPYAKALSNIKPDQRKFIESFLAKKYGTGMVQKLELPFYGTWVQCLKEHVDFWHTNKEARLYAYNDIVYTREVDKHFGYPKMDDDDSVLTCCVASARWKGFALDISGLEALKESNMTKFHKEIMLEGKFIDIAEIHSKPPSCIKYISEVLSDTEKAQLPKKTGKIILENFEKRNDECGRRAREILDCRKAKKEIEMIDKLLISERLHASFSVIGTLSSRMSGSDGLNAQGINKKKYFRKNFPLAFDGYKLVGGDFSGFEVTIFEAVSNDKKLREDLLSGKKIHGIFGTFVYPNMSYEDILKSEGSEDDKYTRSKSALFAMLYGGEARTLMERLGVSKDDAQAAYDSFLNAYPGAKAERMRIKDQFTPLRQEATGKFIWTDHADFVESLYGFKRYFNIEFYAVKALFELSNKLPKDWQKIKGHVVRTKSETTGSRVQTYSGAAMSALYGAANNIQGAVFRQAANHRIQSTGAQITKMLERRLWEVQPVGANDWIVQPINVHDEIMCPCKEEYIPQVTEIVNNLVEEVKPTIPLVKIDWCESLISWAEKGKKK